MRVGIDARLDESGIGRYVAHLIDGLAALDPPLELVLFVRRGRYDQELGLGPHVERRLTDVHWYSAAEQLRMPRLLRAAKLDLVHFPHFNVPLAYRAPFVSTIHDLTHELRRKLPGAPRDPARSRAKALAYRAVVRHAARGARQVIAVSETTKRDIVATLDIPPERVTVTYEGVDTGLFAAADPAALERLGVRGPYLLYVGNTYPHKNLARLLEAFARMRGDAPAQTLVLAGDAGEYREELAARIAELGLDDAVVLTGRIADAELAALYRGASALVLVSLAEGFGLPGLEAMALGVPVVASSIPALQEVYADAARFADPSDVAAIAAALRDVSTDAALRERLVAAGSARVAEFSWRRMAEATRAVYERALA